MDEYLTGRRAAQGGFIEPSFPTIAGSGPHGAIIHYRAQPDSCGTVSASQLLLVDSGVRPQCHHRTHAQPCLLHQCCCSRNSRASFCKDSIQTVITCHLTAPWVCSAHVWQGGWCRGWRTRLHYRGCAVVGGQYDCGTTDVTRTFHLGEPTKHQRVCFTRVLQVAWVL